MFIIDVQDNGPSIGFAMVGGLVLSLGNLAAQYAWAYVGLSVTEVVASSITVVVGKTFISYALPLNFFLPFFLVGEVMCINVKLHTYFIITSQFMLHTVAIEEYL